LPRTIAERLQIKPGAELLLGPSSPEQRTLLDPLPKDVTVVDGNYCDTSGVAVMFAHDRDELDTLLNDVFPQAHGPEGRVDWLPQGQQGRHQPRQHLEACRGVRMDAQRQHLALGHLVVGPS